MELPLRLRLKGVMMIILVRVVLWGKDESNITQNDFVLDAKAQIVMEFELKPGNQGLEIHGNEATITRN